MENRPKTRHRSKQIISLLMCGTILSNFAATATTAYAQVNSEIANKTVSTQAAKDTGMTITANNSSIYAGEGASFQFRYHNALTDNSGILKTPTLKLKLNGVSQAILDSLDLNNLTIMGVAPTLAGTTLVYQFADLKAGADLNIALSLPTQNGITPVGTTYSIDAELSSDSLATPITSNSGNVTVTSQSAFSVSNAFVNTVDSDVQVAAPRIGDETLWKFIVGLPKLATGSSYLKEGSKVVVTYKITGSAVYSGVTAGTPEPTTVSADKQTLTWEFDAPTTAEQESALTNLFEQEFNVQLKINDDAVAFTKVSTNASVTGEFINGQSQSGSHISTVTITQLATTEPPEGAGALHTGFFYGPKDGSGNESNQLANQNPTVYPDSQLRWRLRNGVGYQLSKWDAESARPTDMEISFTMDGHQDLTKFWSASALSWFENEAPTTLTRQPEFDLLVEYEDGQTETLITDVKPDLIYSFTSGEYKLTKPVKKLIFKYSYIPPMNYNPGIYLYTKPKAGFIGETTITPEIKINGNGNQLGQNGTLNSVYDATGIHSYIPGQNGNPDILAPGATQETDDVKGYMGYRSVNVVDYAKTEKRVYSQNISVNSNNKLVLGDNTVKLNLMNLAESQASIAGDISSYVLLPVGVSYADDNDAIEVVDTNYNGTSRTLLKVKISTKQISIGNQLSTSFNVNTANNLLTTGTFDLLTSIDTDTDIYLPDTAVANPFDLMPTKESDINDLDGDGDTSEPIYVSSRSIDFVGTHGISISTDSGFVGADQQRLLASAEGSAVFYKLKLGTDTDNTLEKVNVMGVLPSVSDYGLVTLLNRNSKFDLKLTGPITIKDFQDKFDIYYSTSKYIKTAGVLDANTVYPTGSNVLADHPSATITNWLPENEITDWSTIKSFKLVQKSGQTINSSQLEVNIPLSVPEILSADLLDPTVSAADRSAYLNLAVTANNYLPIENLKSGVYVNKSVNKEVRYVDTEGKQIAASKTITGHIGDHYDVSTSEYKLTIPGYTFKEVEGATTGIFSDNEPTVTYVYTKAEVSHLKTLVVNYVDAAGNKIKTSKTITGNLGDSYDVSTTEFKLTIPGYTLTKVIGEAKGILTDSTQDVTYVYTKNPTKPDAGKDPNGEDQNGQDPIEKDPSDKNQTTETNKNKLPQTNEATNPWLVAIGLVSVALAALLTRVFKKDQRKN